MGSALAMDPWLKEPMMRRPLDGLTCRADQTLHMPVSTVKMASGAATSLSAAPSQTLSPDVDLRDLRLCRQEFVVREISAQEQQKVAFVDRLVTHPETDHAGHSHFIWIVICDVRFPSV